MAQAEEAGQERRAQRGATSLVPSHQTVRAESGTRECLDGPPDLRLVCFDTGEVRPVPCRRLGCPVCLSRAAWRRSLAIQWAQPERFITLTQVGEDWQTIRGRVKAWKWAAAQEFGGVELVYVVERNPRGTGHHVHAWQRGPYMPQARLSELAQTYGMGARVDIRRWESGGEAYALKEAYAVKDAIRAESYLAMNGGRLTHQSRGFFGGPVREVERAAVAAKLGEDSHRWHIVSVAELHKATRGPEDPP